MSHNSSVPSFTVKDEGELASIVGANCFNLPQDMSGWHVADLGAQDGCFAFACLERKAASVVCVDPDPENCRLLEANLASYIAEGRVKILHQAFALDGPPLPTSGRFDLLKLDCGTDLYRLVFDSSPGDWTKFKKIVGTCHTEEDGPPLHTHEALFDRFRYHKLSVTWAWAPKTEGKKTYFWVCKPKEKKPANVLVMRFPYGDSEHPTSVDWLLKMAYEGKNDPRLQQVAFSRIADTPITMTRNDAVERAKGMGADILVMLDSDMNPDIDIPDAVPFWKAAFNFWWDYPDPCVIGAPYCGPPPHENVYVFKWRNVQSDHPDPDFQLQAFTREEAAEMTGVKRVAALPTGLILCDMRAFEKLTPPYFYYEFPDKYATRKASTEDVAWSRDLDFLGVPLFCTWNSWAGHWKRKCVGKPMPVQPGGIPIKFRRAMDIAAGSASLNTPAPAPINAGGFWMV